MAPGSKMSRAIPRSTFRRRRRTVYNLWYRHSGQPEVDGLPWDSDVPKEVDVREITPTIGEHYITHMWCCGDIPPLHVVAPKLTHLKISYPPDHSTLESLTSRRHLRVLNLFGNKFTSGLPSAVVHLTTLTELNLSGCSLTDLPDNLTSLCHLRVLNLSNNNFTSGLPSAVVHLTTLTELNLSRCNLTDLPDNLTSLRHLRVLNLSNNNFTYGLPSAVAHLTTLTELNLNCCRLIDLPDTLSQLRQLTSLNLSHNYLVKIPPCVFNLESLNTLDVSCNYSLYTLDGLMQLTQLVELNCESCPSLTFPPYAVCQQGLAAVRQYFTDLSSTHGVELSVVPVSIVGEKLAGKTSLVQSLQTGQRSLTYRSVISPLDETTKVFEVKDLQLENSLAKLIDHGGHKVYHITHRYILKERNIPLVVVSMEEFSNLSSKCGPKEAIKRICLDWLSHLYLPSPLLGAPLLVFTHADKLTTSITQCQQDFLQLAEVVREEMLAEEAAQWGQDGHLNQILHWSNREVPLFSPEDVFVFSDDKSETANIDALKARLESHCVKFRTVIPRLWEDVGKFVDGKKAKPFITLSAILSEYPGDDCLVILRYMHNTGSILWFEHTEHLNQYIFHRIPEMTAMIAVLFHHRSEEEWKKRLDTFTAFRHGKDMIDRDEYEKLYTKFTTTGILDEAILMRLLETESKFPPAVALELLQCFCIVHGPIKQSVRDAYVIPYFATTCMGNSWETDGSLQLRLDIKLHGLSLPMYGYQLATAAVLNNTMSPFNTTTVASDGVTIHHGESATHLIHRSDEKKMTLQVSTTLEQLGDSWKRLFDTAKNILELLSHVWIACRPSILVYCSHCLFQRDAQPCSVVNPEWFCPVFEGSSRENTSSVVNMCHYTGVEPVTCKRHAAISKDLRPTVPKPLLLPCYHLTDDEIDKVNDYLTDIEYNRPTNTKDTVQQPPPTYRPRPKPRPRQRAVDDGMSDLSDVEESGYCDESSQVRITTRLNPDRSHKMKDRYNKDDGVGLLPENVPSSLTSASNIYLSKSTSSAAGVTSALASLSLDLEFRGEQERGSEWSDVRQQGYCDPSSISIDDTKVGQLTENIPSSSTSTGYIQSTSTAAEPHTEVHTLTEELPITKLQQDKEYNLLSLKLEEKSVEVRRLKEQLELYKQKNDEITDRQVKIHQLTAELQETKLEKNEEISKLKSQLEKYKVGERAELVPDETLNQERNEPITDQLRQGTDKVKLLEVVQSCEDEIDPKVDERTTDLISARAEGKETTESSQTVAHPSLQQMDSGRSFSDENRSLVQRETYVFLPCELNQKIKQLCRNLCITDFQVLQDPYKWQKVLVVAPDAITKLTKPLGELLIDNPKFSGFKVEPFDYDGDSETEQLYWQRTLSFDRSTKTTGAATCELIVQAGTHSRRVFVVGPAHMMFCKEANEKFQTDKCDIGKIREEIHGAQPLRTVAIRSDYNPEVVIQPKPMIAYRYRYKRCTLQPNHHKLYTNDCVLFEFQAAKAQQVQKDLCSANLLRYEELREVTTTNQLQTQHSQALQIAVQNYRGQLYHSVDIDSDIAKCKGVHLNFVLTSTDKDGNPHTLSEGDSGSIVYFIGEKINGKERHQPWGMLVQSAILPGLNRRVYGAIALNQVFRDIEEDYKLFPGEIQLYQPPNDEADASAANVMQRQVPSACGPVPSNLLRSSATQAQSTSLMPSNQRTAATAHACLAGHAPANQFTTTRPTTVQANGIELLQSGGNYSVLQQATGSTFMSEQMSPDNTDSDCSN